MYFEEWPFVTTAPKKPKIIADRYNAREEIEDFLYNFFTYKKTQFYSICGIFGSGKSHILRYYGNKLMRDNNVLFLYSPSFPLNIKNFIDFYRESFFNLIDPEYFIKTIKNIWLDLIEKKGREQALDILTKNISNNWFDLVKVWKILCEFISYSTTEELYEDDIFRLTYQWMSGLKLYKRDLKNLNITFNIDNDELVLRVLCSIIKFLTIEDSEKSYSSIFWAIDDCHLIGNLTPKYRNTILRGIKYCYDGVENNFLIFLSFAGHDEEIVYQLLSPDLKSRLQNKPIFLPLFNKRQAINYLNDILKEYSLKEQQYYPFNEKSIIDTINLIIKHNDELTPRILNQELDGLVKSAQRKLFPSIIDSDFVHEYFERRYI